MSAADVDVTVSCIEGQALCDACAGASCVGETVTCSDAVLPMLQAHEAEVGALEAAEVMTRPEDDRTWFELSLDSPLFQLALAALFCGTLVVAWWTVVSCRRRGCCHGQRSSRPQWRGTSVAAPHAKPKALSEVQPLLNGAPELAP